MLEYMRSLLIIFCLYVGHTVADQRWSLGADVWAQPRDGRVIADMSPLPEVIDGWMDQPAQTLVIRYPGGEEGLLWAHELRAWLTALGVPLNRQELMAGSHQPETIELELVQR